jgi:hypothetical protein
VFRTLRDLFADAKRRSVMTCQFHLDGRKGGFRVMGCPRTAAEMQQNSLRLFACWHISSQYFRVVSELTTVLQLKQTQQERRPHGEDLR